MAEVRGSPWGTAQHLVLTLGTGLLQCDGDMGTGRVERAMSEPLACLSRADSVECRAHAQPTELQSLADWCSAARLHFPSCSSPGDRALLERGSSWEGGFAWQDAKTARAVVGFTAGSGLGKSLRQCRNPFFQVLRLKETCN